MEQSSAMSTLILGVNILEAGSMHRNVVDFHGWRTRAPHKVSSTVVRTFRRRPADWLRTLLGCRPSLTGGFRNPKPKKKKIRKCVCVFYVLSRALDAESDRTGLALIVILAGLWLEVSRNVRVGSSGVGRIFGVEKYHEEISISTYARMSTFYPET